MSRFIKYSIVMMNTKDPEEMNNFKKVSDAK